MQQIPSECGSYIDCPICGVNKIPPGCKQCGECQIVERDAEEIESLHALLREALPFVGSRPSGIELAERIREILK